MEKFAGLSDTARNNILQIEKGMQGQFGYSEHVTYQSMAFLVSKNRFSKSNFESKRSDRYSTNCKGWSLEKISDLDSSAPARSQCFDPKPYFKN